MPTITVPAMVEQRAVCPACGEVVSRRHDGSEQGGANEFNDPLVFVEHLHDDWRADLLTRTPCPGSGRNVALARAAL